MARAWEWLEGRASMSVQWVTLDELIDELLLLAVSGDVTVDLTLSSFLLDRFFPPHSTGRSYTLSLFTTSHTMAQQAPSPDYPVHFENQDSFNKPSYDDLIDQYASPYATANKHKSTYSKMSLSTEETMGKGGMDTADDLRRSTAYPPPVPPLPAQDNRTFLQKYLPDSMEYRLYLLTVLVETTIDLAVEGDLLLRVHEVGEADEETAASINALALKMPVYLGIFALAHVFQFCLACDAVYARNTLQLIFLAMFNALFLLYSIIQSSEIHSVLANTSGIIGIPINALLIIVPCVISVCELVYIGLGWKIHTEFGWKVDKFLGADRRIKQMYTQYQIFQCLIKFNLFFWLGYCVQLIWLVLPKSDPAFYVTCVALPLSVILLVEGFLAARYEHKWMMITFLTGCSGGLVYFAYQFVKTVVNRNTDDYKNVWQSLAVFSVLALILLVATIVYTCLVFRNFGRGLKEQVAKNQSPNVGWGGAKHNVYPSMSANPNRMSID